MILTVCLLILDVEGDDLALAVEGMSPREVRRPGGETGDGEALRHFGHLLFMHKFSMILIPINLIKPKCRRKPIGTFLDDEVDDALRGSEAVLRLADEDGGVFPARLPQQEPRGQSARGLLVLNL